MSQLNVVVGTSLPPNLIEEIQKVDSALVVSDAAALILAEFSGALRPGQGLPQPAPPGSNLNILLKTAEIFLAPRRLPPDFLSRAPRLKWIQATSAGVDYLDDTGVMESEILLTTASGIHAVPVTEWALTAMLALAKQVPRLVANRKKKAWDRFNLAELHGKTLGVVGLGNIGGRMAQIGKALGMRVVASRRSISTTKSSSIDAMLPYNKLKDLLSQSDYVVLAVPLTPETKGLIGEDELRAMKPSAILINVARGPVVDESALVTALKEGWIAGAGLDVFQKEPLPEESELWTLPNVFMSAHIAGLSDAYDARVVELFGENLKRYMAGKELLNLVDKTRGY